MIELTDDQLRAQLREAGKSEDAIKWAHHIPEEVRRVQPTVRAVTGHPVRTFAQWAAEHKHAFC